MAELGLVEAAKQAIIYSNPEVLDQVLTAQLRGKSLRTRGDSVIWHSLPSMELHLSPQDSSIPLSLVSVSQELFRLHSAQFNKTLFIALGIDQETLVLRDGDTNSRSPYPDSVLCGTSLQHMVNIIAGRNNLFYGAVTQMVGLAATAGERFHEYAKWVEIKGYASALDVAKRFKTPAATPREVMERFQFLFDEEQPENASDIIQKNESFGRCPAYHFFGQVYASYGRKLKTPAYQKTFLRRVANSS